MDFTNQTDIAIACEYAKEVLKDRPDGFSYRYELIANGLLFVMEKMRVLQERAAERIAFLETDNQDMRVRLGPAGYKMLERLRVLEDTSKVSKYMAEAEYFESKLQEMTSNTLRDIEKIKDITKNSEVLLKVVDLMMEELDWYEDKETLIECRDLLKEVGL